MILFSIFLMIWFAYWSAEAGASLPWSGWQYKKSWYSEIPEAVIALSIGCIGVWGWDKIIDISALWLVGTWLFFISVSYAGKQSGTWAYLRWETHKDPNTERGGTLKKFNDYIASLFGYKLGQEGYAWIWAATKGFIITIPLGGILGMIFFPLGHELGSHAKGRLSGDANMWKELASGIGLGVACIAFIKLILLFIK